MTDARVAVAVIGLGAISHSVHLPLIRRNADRFDLTAVVDLSLDRAQATAAASGGDVAAFTSIDAAIRSRTSRARRWR